MKNLTAVVLLVLVLGLSATAIGASIISRATGNWNSVDTWTAITRTGTITTITSSSAVTGSGTLFTTEIAVGDRIMRSDGTTSIGIVSSIIDNTHLTLTTNASNTNTNVVYRARKIPGAADDVTMADATSVTVTANASCLSLTIAGGGTANTLTINTGISLAVSGAVTINAGTGYNDDKTIAWAREVSVAHRFRWR